MDASINSPAQHDIDQPSCNNDSLINCDAADRRNRDSTPSFIQTQELLDLVLNFLSTSSNEKLLCTLGILVAATYLLLGRLGLLLIGVTAGATLHASWEGPRNNHTQEFRGSSRRELSLIITRKLLDRQSRRPTGISSLYDDDEKTTKNNELSAEFDPAIFGPATTAALKSLTDAVVKDYVNYWYEPILPSESTFPLSCRRTLTRFITSISTSLYRKRTADTFLEFLTNSSSMVIVILNELSAAYEFNGSLPTPEQTVRCYLEAYPDSSLSSILANQQQHKKLSMISDDILSNFLDSHAYSCPPVKDFLREVLSGVVLESTVSSLSRPEFINGWIVYLFSEGESEIMSAIDAGVEGARTEGMTATTGPGTVDRELPLSTNTESNMLAKEDHNKTDKATEDAMVEAKRLSDMIAAQDLRGHDDRTARSSLGNGTPLGDHAGAVSNLKMGDGARESTVDPKLEPQTKQTLDTHESVSYSASPRKSTPPLQSTHSSPSHSAVSHTKNNSISTNLTLHLASITVDDSSGTGEKGPLRSKPTTDYLLQIEPLSTRSTGWMVFRKYSEFESIHETLCTISRLNDIRSFVDTHPVIPQWKGQTRRALARSLEQYVQDALKHEALAESERMRRFLEKDGPLGPRSAGEPAKSTFFFPNQNALENVGKGVLGVLANAPKSVSGGGKAVYDGVTGVFTGGANKRTSLLSSTASSNERSAGVSTQATNLGHIGSQEAGGLRENGSLRAIGSDIEDSVPRSGTFEPDEVGLEPLSNESHEKEPSDTSREPPRCEQKIPDISAANSFSYSTSACEDNNTPSGLEEETETSCPATKKFVETTVKCAPRNQSSPITDDETRMAVELIFAVINELYSLSSAWAIRRTLLNAAKSYILRPGNPSLETIRSLLQDSMIDQNTSDESIGLYLQKLRENALPTEEELRSWPASMSEAEKERLRETARRVLVQRGLPQAITGVMGAAASREALGKIFDCLQVESVARGLMFAIMLQTLSTILL